MAPDDSFLVSGAYDKTARLWNAATGKELRRFTIKEGALQAVSLAPDGKTLATIDEQAVRLWDAAGGKELRKLAGQAGYGRPTFSRDSKTLAIGAGDGIVRVWETASGRKLVEFRAHPENVHSLSFSGDGKTLVTGYADSPIHVWDVATGRQKLVLDGHQERLLVAAWAPDGRRVATAGWDRTVRVWDPETAKELLRLEGDFDYVERVAYSADGTRLFAAVSRTRNVPHLTIRYALLIWDAVTGKLIRELEGSHAAVTRDGRLVAAATYGASGGVVILYDAHTGAELRRLLGNKSQIRELGFSPDGKTLTAVAQNVFFGARIPGEDERQDAEAIHVWDVESGAKKRSFGGKNFISALTVSPDGRTLATSGLRESSVHLWEALTGQERAQVVGHKDMVFASSFSPDGRTLATGGMDGTLRLWDMPSGKELCRLEGHRGWVLGIAWSPDGRKLVTTSTDTSALVWDVGMWSGRKPETRKLTTDELDSAWQGLAGDARRAFESLATLLTAPAQTVPLLAERLKPVPAPEPTRLAQLISELGSEKFAVRDAASKELEKCGEAVETALAKAGESAKDLELRRRIETMLERIKGHKLRALRAVEALERIGSDDARAVLRSLAGETRPVGREAAQALKRLETH